MIGCDMIIDDRPIGHDESAMLEHACNGGEMDMVRYMLSKSKISCHII